MSGNDNQIAAFPLRHIDYRFDGSANLGLEGRRDANRQLPQSHKPTPAGLKELGVSIEFIVITVVLGAVFGADDVEHDQLARIIAGDAAGDPECLLGTRSEVGGMQDRMHVSFLNGMR